MLAEGPPKCQWQKRSICTFEETEYPLYKAKGVANKFPLPMRADIIEEKAVTGVCSGQALALNVHHSVLVPRYQASLCAHWSNQGRSARGSLQGPSVAPNSAADAGVSEGHGQLRDRIYRADEDAQYQHHWGLRSLYPYFAARSDRAFDDSDAAFGVVRNGTERNAPNYSTGLTAKPSRGCATVWAGIPQTT